MTTFQSSLVFALALVVLGIVAAVLTVPEALVLSGAGAFIALMVVALEYD